jgi:type II secretory pathway predicted ATPase ExeA
VQAELGIVRVEETTAAAVEAAIAEALQRFDRMGEEGVAKRQQFALGQHMLPNRLAEMMETLAAVARREVIVPEVRKPGFGLYLRERPAAPAG